MFSTTENKRINRKLAQLQYALHKNIIKSEYDVKWILGKLENINYRVVPTNYLKSKNAEWIGYTALHFAADEYDLEAFDILLNHSADFTLENNNNLTPLHIIIDNNAIIIDNNPFLPLEDHKLDNPFTNSVLSAHLKYSNFRNPSNDNGLSHFHLACAVNNIEVVKGFLQNGVSIDHSVKIESPTFSGFTSLHFAVKYCALEVAKLLLTHGANVRIKDAKGKTPLHVALERQLEIISDTGSDEILRDRNELILLLFFSKHKNVTMIIDNWGLSNFHVSCTLKDSKTAEYLLQNVVDVNGIVSMNSPFWPGYTALHFAALCNLDTVKLLMKNGADINLKDAKGVTPFDMCIERYENKDIYTIISLNAFWKNIMLSDGKTRLSELVFAMRDSNQFDMFLRKLSKNFKICYSPLWPGYTPLHIAVILAKTRTRTNEASERMSLEILKNLCEKNYSMLYSQDVHGHTPLHLAYRLNKKPVINLLMHFLQECPNFVDRVDEDGLSFIHIASAQDNIHILGRLLAMDINVNATYEGQSSVFPNICRGSTALHFAVVNGCKKAVEALMSCGADVNARNNHGMTPMHMVLLGEKRKIGKILLTSPNLTESVVDGIGLSHLHIACLCGNTRVVKRLINNGADINRRIIYQPDVSDQSSETSFLKTHAGHSPLSIACKEHSYRTINLLLQRGADMFINNPEGKTMLYEIIRMNHTVYFFHFVGTLRRNQDLHARLRADTGMSSLHIACLHSDFRLVQRIIAEGENVNARIPSDSPIWEGYTPLHVLVHINEKFTSVNATQIINIFLKANVDVTLQNKESQTVIHMLYEIVCNHTDDWENVSDDWRCLWIDVLLQAQKDFSVNPVNIDGISHFLIACCMCNIGIVQKFLDHVDTIDIDQAIDYFRADQSGFTALHLAASSNPQSVGLSKQLKTIDLLLNHGANVNVEDAKGNTPLHKCARSDSLDLMERLVRSGADVNARNILGETPLSVFLRSGNVTVEGIKALIRFGCYLNAYNAVTHTGHLGEIIDVLTYADIKSLVFTIIVNFKDKMDVDYLGRTAIHNMVSIKPPKILPIQYASLFEQLSEIGCDVDNQDNLGRTALHMAVKFYNYEAVSGLLLAGADINIVDNNGNTAFAWDFDSCKQCENKEQQDENLCKHLATLKVLITHIKKLQLSGLDVNEQNEILAVRACEKFNTINLLREQFFYELEVIKITIIAPHSLILYDFLSENGAVADYPTMSQMKRDDIKKFFSVDRVLSIRERFPDIAGILQLQYRKARARSKLVESSKNALKILIGFRLPEVCSNYILILLKNSELKNLIKAC